MVVLQGVPAVIVVFTGGGDLDPGTQSLARGSAVVQVSGFLVLVPRKDLGTKLPAAGFEIESGGGVQRERLLRLRAEDFVGCKVRII